MDEYPDIEDENFQFLIAQRLEFRSLDNIDGLYPHQEFVRRFMSPYTPYRSLIMYHSLGSGKSIACIAVAVDHHIHDGKRCIIVTKGDSGSDNFRKQIKMYRLMSSTRDRWDENIFSMKHYISMSNQINNMSDDDVKNVFSNKIIVLDEVHNVRYLKKEIEHSVYGSIVRLLKTCTNVKVIMATATPMTDNTEQINSLLGICNWFREDKTSMNGIISYNSTIRDKPDTRKVGTEDCVPGMWVYTSEMTGYQLEVYRRESRDKPPNDIYRDLTHISLFCFDDGTHGREVTETKMTKTRRRTTVTCMSTKQTKEIKYVKYDIAEPHARFLVGDELRKCSSKYSRVIEDLGKSEGNVFIFLEEVKGSGLLLLAAVLERHGYELYVGEEISNVRPAKRYTMCVGSSDICPNINDRLEGFNSYDNRNGDYVRILLGSKVIGESITLKNVRQFYCLTPHWNDSTIDQAIGRVVRNGSHVDLEEDKRNVDIYIHASVLPVGEERHEEASASNPEEASASRYEEASASKYEEVDVKKLDKCKQKEKKIQEVAQVMIDNAVDRYCLIETNVVQVTNVLNFAAAYIHNLMDDITNAVSSALASWPEPVVDTRDLSAYLEDMDQTVLEEALCRIIHSNTELLGGGFLRAWDSYVFVVRDPSLPYVMIPDVDYPTDESSVAFAPIEPKLHFEDRFTFVQNFRYIPVKHKADLLENAVSSGRYDMLECLDTLYACIRGQAYHLLLYRNLESSYTSSNPVPKKPVGKTRKFDGTTWSFVESREEEQAVFDVYRALVDDTLDKADAAEHIYGLISTIDGDMRLRLRGIEDKQKSSKDHRYVRRGKNMKSIRKDTLIDILQFILPDSDVDDMTPISDIAMRIDEAIVEAELYIML